MIEVTAGVGFVVEDCCHCGITFAVTKDFNNRRRNDHDVFYCPQGHGQSYQHETETERLRKQLQRAESLRIIAQNERDAALKQAKNAETRATKLRRRVARGVCPCCNRTFENLARHMSMKHPEAR